MYKTHKEVKQLCLICLKEIEVRSVKRFINKNNICDNCLSQYEYLLKKYKVCGYDVLILYNYNAFFKELLYRYKGLYDYMLKDAFILNKTKFKERYKDYYVIVAPSDNNTNKIRAFVPNVEIVKCFSSNIFVGLYKKYSFKQSDQRYEKRKLIKDVIDIKEGEILKGKKVLIFDDVITSSNTLKTCIRLVEKYEPIHIECLILATKSFNERVI